jgi:hypothetical protein
MEAVQLRTMLVLLVSSVLMVAKVPIPLDLQEPAYTRVGLETSRQTIKHTEEGVKNESLWSNLLLGFFNIIKHFKIRKCFTFLYYGILIFLYYYLQLTEK